MAAAPISSPASAPIVARDVAPTSAPAGGAAPSAPSSPAPAAPTTGSAPGPAPAVDATAAVNGLVSQTKDIDTAYTASISQVKAAVALLGANPKLSDADQGAVSRLSMIGVMLDDADAVKDAKPVTLPKGANASQIIAQAETSFMQSVAKAAQQAETVGAQVDPAKVSKDVVSSFVTAQGRITDAIYAVRYANKLVPAPTPATPTTGTAKTPAPATPAPAQGSTPAPAPAAPAQAPATPAPATPATPPAQTGAPSAPAAPTAAS